MLFSTLAINAQQSIAGIWNTGKENTKVEIAEADGIYEDKIVSSDNAKAKIGKQMLKEISFVDGVWKGKIVQAGLMSKTVQWSKDEL